MASVKRIIVLVLGIVGGIVTGILLSQYAPLFGTWEKFGEPWSPARMQLISIHVAVFLVVGALGGWLIARKLAKVPKG